ncbi:MAG: 16S rRNA methyltransferase [Acidobacterium sp.]|nr:16S rRNA (cytosine(1402)-N(4))-methyltransferase RsmH [Acidobacteriota bacterium]PHY10798.1 MAG: 16S rRNA methyltransferase [Acidobacterium sp.]
MDGARHVPVLLDEVRSLLQPERGGIFVDCTLGLGGHSRMLLESGATRVIGIDRDTDAIAIAKDTLAAFADRVTFVHADYREVAEVLDRQGVTEVTGLLADFGVSSMQLDTDGRGFSFKRDEPLDMRMDRSQGETVADLLDRVDETELADVIYRFGEERRSRQVARAIVMARGQSPITTTGRLAEIVRRGVAARGWQRIDPATRTFQALRIWVNRELDELDSFIGRAASRLQVEGRLGLIAFHSLEDRVVKHTLRDLARGDDAVIKVLTKHPVIAGDAEAAVNPRARSAKLRAAERIR